MGGCGGRGGCFRSLPKFQKLPENFLGPGLMTPFPAVSFS